MDRTAIPSIETELGPDEQAEQQLLESRSAKPSVEPSYDVDQLVFGIVAYWETLKPVAVTLVLASLAVAFVRFDLVSDSNNNSMSVFQIQDDDQTLSDSEKLGESMVNAIVIVLFIGTFTFLIVLIYWLRCMSFLHGYMILSSFILLSIIGGMFIMTVFYELQIPIDTISILTLVVNLAVVGVASIFFQRGIPKYITQNYLIAISVLLSWQLSQFDEWTAWSLLVMLAFYDLCAVLSPIGPLRALVGLMQQRPNDQLPGLLYEADVEQELSPRKSVQLIDSISVESDNSAKVILYSDLEVEAPSLIHRETEISASVANYQSLDSSSHHNPEGVQTDHIPDNGSTANNSIKLGIGDFVFYSVLVSRAAQHSFLSFLVAFVVILAGLGITLGLLSIYKKALPALPISILSGVLAYFLSRLTMEQYVNLSLERGYFI